MGSLLAAGISAYAQTDSLELLFDDTSVRQYTLTFYDNGWQSIMENNYAEDLGYLAARFSDGKITLDSVGVRYKGNSSYNATGTSPKKPYKIKFNEFRDGQTYYSAKILNFSNGYGDPSFLREKIAYDISRAYMPTPRANFATLSVGTDLIGLYTEVEQVDKPFLADWFTDNSLNLFKASDAGASLLYEGATASLYADDLELKTNETANDWTGMVAFLTFLNNSDSATFCSSYATYLNTDNVTAFLAFNMVLSHFDSYTGSGRNFYMYQEGPAGYMSFIPWDMNLAFGGYPNGWDVYAQSALTTDNLGSRPLLKRVLSCDSLRNKYLGYIRHMIQNKASAASVADEATRLAAVIRSSVEADPNKFYTLANFESNLTTNLRTSSGAIPGLTYFSTTRNAFLLNEVTAALPSGYVLPVRANAAAVPLAVRKINGRWFLQGVELLDRYQVDFFQLNGKTLSSVARHGSAGPLELALPEGLVLLRVHSNSTTQYFQVNNY